MSNTLEENMRRFGTKNLTEQTKIEKVGKQGWLSGKQNILKGGGTSLSTPSHAEVYRLLDAYTSTDDLPYVVAEVIYKAKGYINDSPAWVIAALQKSNKAIWKKASSAFQIRYRKDIIEYMTSYLKRSEVTEPLHNNTSIQKELERLYGETAWSPGGVLSQFNISKNIFK
jgi:hypothetical protein